MPVLEHETFRNIPPDGVLVSELQVGCEGEMRQIVYV